VLQVAANWNGWLVVDLPGYPSEKILVSWDDDIRKKWKIIQMFQTTNHMVIRKTSKTRLPYNTSAQRTKQLALKLTSLR
jgi:hypothetical protein